MTSLSKIPGLSLYQGLSPKHKKRANLVLGGLASVVVVSTVSWVLSSSAPKPPPKELKNETMAEISAPGSAKVDPQQYWMAVQGKRLDQFEDFMSKIQQERAGRMPGSVAAPTASAPSSDSAAVAATSAASAASAASGAASGVSSSATQGAAKAPAANNAAIAAAPEAKSKTSPTPYPRQSSIVQAEGGIPAPRRVDPNAPGANLGLNSYPPGSPNAGVPDGGYFAPATARAPGIVSVKVSATDAKDAKGADKPAGAKWNVSRNFMPVGFVRAKLLGGIDASTGGQSQSDPQPMIFLLQDDAVLPNGWRSKVRNCFVVAGGVGDLSSERAFGRLLNLSCIKHNGDVLEVAVKGSVFGEDGKNGMRGRLVTKQGQILANAAMAGIASGIGKGFGNQGVTVSQSPLGVTTQQSQDAKTVLNNAMAQGFGSAMDRLAQYWIERADRMYPVIEIDAGRVVDLAFTKGVEVDLVPGDDQDEGLLMSGRNLNRSAEIAALFKDQ